MEKLFCCFVSISCCFPGLLWMGVGASGTWLFPHLEANLALAGFPYPRRLLISSFPCLVPPSLCLISLLLPFNFFHFRFLFFIGFLSPCPAFSPSFLYDLI